MKIVFLPYGIGDALQCIPALGDLKSPEDELIAVVVLKNQKLLWRSLLPKGFKVFSCRDHINSLLYSCDYLEIYDLNGLSSVAHQVTNNFSSKIKLHIAHTVFTNSLLNESPCVCINGVAIKNSNFFDIPGEKSWPAALFYRSMIWLSQEYPKINLDIKNIFSEKGIQLKPLDFSFIKKNRKLSKIKKIPGTKKLFPNYKVTMLHTGGKKKRWPLSKVIQIVKKMRNANFDVTVVLGPKETSVAKKIQKAGINPLNIDLKKLKDFLLSQDLCIANDTGPMHLSAILGIPTLAIFGPTEPKSWFPYKFPGQVALKKQQLKNDQIIWPSAREVLFEAMSILRKKQHCRYVNRLL